VVTAESCTAGLVAAVLSYGEKASECFHGGFVVYTKQQKSTALGVEPGALKERGSVHEIVAAQMAEGALHRSGAKIALSVTGVLGPHPDEDNNPPGLVYLAVARSGRPTIVAQHHFKSVDPDVVRKSVLLEALDLIAFGTE
jgi:nicotinamide-nucleotide amidase